MSSCGDHGAWHILKQSLSQEGPSFLFKGWTPAFIRLGPNTVLLFVFFEVSINDDFPRQLSSHGSGEANQAGMAKIYGMRMHIDLIDYL
jgi:dicarboxylate transporter 10